MGQSGSSALIPVIVVDHAGIPVLECGTQRAVQGPGPRLQQQMSPTSAPLHLLLLDHGLANHLVDSRFHKARADAFALKADKLDRTRTSMTSMRALRSSHSRSTGCNSGL